MTNFALTVYRRQTRYALEVALGRKVTNDEHTKFLIRLQCEAIDPWIQEQANKEAFTITAAAESRALRSVGDTTPSDR